MEIFFNNVKNNKIRLIENSMLSGYYIESRQNHNMSGPSYFMSFVIQFSFVIRGRKS